MSESETCDRCGHFKVDHSAVCQECFSVPPSMRIARVRPAHAFRHTHVWTLAVVVSWTHVPRYERDPLSLAHQDAAGVLLVCACGDGQRIDP